MTPDQWPEVVPDLTRTCQSLGDAHLGAKLLLSILTELPNEVSPLPADQRLVGNGRLPTTCTGMF